MSYSSSGRRRDPLEKIKEEVGSGVSELYSRYDCDYCQEDIPGLRIRCAECPDFDLCMDCFAAGATNGKHKNSHPYLFMNNGGFAVFPSPMSGGRHLTNGQRTQRQRHQYNNSNNNHNNNNNNKYSAQSNNHSSHHPSNSTPSNPSTPNNHSNHTPPPSGPSSSDSLPSSSSSSCSNSSSNCSSSSNSLLPLLREAQGNAWNAREEVRLLDAVEQFGYGNWKDISRHIETKSPEAAEKQYNSHYIHGVVGRHTWREELRGNAVDHTLEAERGLMSPSGSYQLPPLFITSEEALLLGYMPHRDDYEDFDKETEALVSQISDKSVEDEDLDVALKLAQCDIYERKLREQVRRKRVARDYQLVSKFFAHNPIVQIGSRVNSLKINSQIRAVKRLADAGPQAELYDAFKSLSQFLSCRELTELLDNICAEKELKIRIKELFKYREHGLTMIEELIPFEKLRFKREFKLRRLANKNKPVVKSGPRLLPVAKDYSIRALLNPHSNIGEKRSSVVGTPNGVPKKKKAKKSKWSRRKEKTGRRLLIQQGCILTVSDRRDSTDSN